MGPVRQVAIHPAGLLADVRCFCQMGGIDGHGIGKNAGGTSRARTTVELPASLRQTPSKVGLIVGVVVMGEVEQTTSFIGSTPTYMRLCPAPAALRLLALQLGELAVHPVPGPSTWLNILGQAGGEQRVQHHGQLGRAGCPGGSASCPCQNWK